MRKRDTNVLSLLEDKTNSFARKTALGMKTNFGWRELTYDGLGLMARRLASYLINDLGIQKEEKMAILSESKPEFGVCVLASVISGMITVSPVSKNSLIPKETAPVPPGVAITVLSKFTLALPRVHSLHKVRYSGFPWKLTA